MKVTVLVSKNSPYTEHAKSVMIRLSREIDIEYEIYEVGEGEVPVSAKGRELPCFLAGEKVIWEGRPNYEMIKRAIEKGSAKGIGERILRSIWGRKK